MKTRVNNLLLK